MFIVEDLTVSVKWRTAIKALFVYINLCLSVMLYILFTSISSVPSDGALEIRWPTIVEILPFLLHVYSIKMLTDTHSWKWFGSVISGCHVCLMQHHSVFSASYFICWKRSYFYHKFTISWLSVLLKKEIS